MMLPLIKTALVRQLYWGTQTFATKQKFDSLEISVTNYAPFPALVTSYIQ